MIHLVDGLSGLPLKDLNLYHTTDPHLSNLPIILFHGSSTTANSTLNSSRIQIHVFSAAGFQSYPRLTISPNSPFYAAVYDLPQEWQGDEVCRALAFGLFKYFKDIPDNVRSSLVFQHSKYGTERPRSAPIVFSGQHAASLASSMVRVENIEEVVQDLRVALQPQTLSHIDIDLVLPPGAIVATQEERDDLMLGDGDSNSSFCQHGV